MPETPVAIPAPVGLIIGCARSGTSILGELIAAHPGAHYIYEAHDLWERAGAGPNASHRLTEAAATPGVIAGVREWFARERAEQPGALIVEKCPRNALRVPFLRRVLPGAKIIHIIRDGRDVACSLRPGVGGATWNHLKPPDWEALFALPWAERCARLWLEVVETAEGDLAREDSIFNNKAPERLLIRYEDLVREPERIARVVFNYLELPWRGEIEAFLGNIADAAGGYEPTGATRKWNTADHARRIGRWRENMTPDEQTRVHDILAGALARYGYL